MLLHEHPTDRENMKTSPGPVYMTNEQFAEYLKNLRSNRVGRPSGARPLSSIQSDFNVTNYLDNTHEPLQFDVSPISTGKTLQSSSTLPHRRITLSPSSFLTEKSYLGCRKSPSQLIHPPEVVPGARYIERRQRWLEREEAIALREAMEDMDINGQSDEFRLFAAAQKEASDLVWQHQNSDFVMKSDQPYHYKSYLQNTSRKHPRPRSICNNGRISPAINSIKDGASLRSSYSRGPGSYVEDTPRGRSSFCSSDLYGSRRKYEEIGVDGKNYRSLTPVKDFEKISTPRRSPQGSTRGLRSSLPSWSNSERGKICGDVRSSLYNSEQICEEPELSVIPPEIPQDMHDVPLPLLVKSKNSPNRVKFSPDVEIFPNNNRLKSPKNQSFHDVQKNPPSQKLNCSYVSNPPPIVSLKKSTEFDSTTVAKVKNGLEIRSDEIKQATSMLLKDRSPKLPLPSVVSDKPGRPIVSFDSNWRPKEADMKPETPKMHPKNVDPGQGLLEESSSKVDTNPSPAKHITSRTPNKVTNFYTRPVSHDIDNSFSRSMSRENLARSSPIPTIQLSESPSTSISNPDVPTIIIGTPENKSKRPLPVPSLNRRYLSSRTEFSRGHWSPAIGQRSTVICHQCGLSIENRVLKVGGNEHFHPECFCCSTCGTGLESLEIYPEPSEKRIERLDRIKRRARGEILQEVDGMTKEDDGDEKQRYYCHLDFHENFAPRCKHCKTPIIGEHLVALGQHWHHGHFFCAECGDPFDKGATHIEKDGYAWCLSCQTKRTERRAPKCQKCKKPVVGQYIQALGGEWHEDCFHCATCKKGFDNSSFYPMQTGGETVVLCTECAERELKA